MFQVFELGLLDIRAHVVDSLSQPGGQCVELYADKPIYDIPAIPVCTGRELTERLLQQTRPFGATFHYGQQVAEVIRQDDARFFVATSKGTTFLAKTVFIAGGVGAFQPRRLKVDGIDAFDETQLFYDVTNPALFAGKDIVIVGGGDSALEAALNFVSEGPNRAASVTLVHRRAILQAQAPSIAAIKAQCDRLAMQFIVGQVAGFDEDQGRLLRLHVAGADGMARSLPVDMLVVFVGLSPRLGPIVNWGLGLDRKQIVVDTAKFETNIPGVFAVGDINTYPGKKKLILSGFHEATLAAFGASPYVHPEKQVLLQYTTTSPKLHQLLGVKSPVAD